MKMSLRALAIVFAATLGSAFAYAADKPNAQALANELLAADRGFSAASAKTDLITAVSAMLSEEAVMPVAGANNAFGRTKIIEALRSNPLNEHSRMQWQPVRAGVSADGLHGFTFGYFTSTQPDQPVAHGKYLSYWIKGAQGWRVAAYKRGLAPGAATIEMMAPALPPALLPAVSDPVSLAKLERSLASAEQAFSDASQMIGLGSAFVLFGSTDAVNMGGRDSKAFVVGAKAIGRIVAGDDPTGNSTVSWKADKVIVASTGDLGVSIGMIRENVPSVAGKPAAQFPFFTVWQRATTQDPWLYIAE